MYGPFKKLLFEMFYYYNQHSVKIKIVHMYDIMATSLDTQSADCITLHT